MVINIIQNLIQGRFIGNNWVRSSWVPGGTRVTARDSPWRIGLRPLSSSTLLRWSVNVLLGCKTTQTFQGCHSRNHKLSPLPHAQKEFLVSMVKEKKNLKVNQAALFQSFFPPKSTFLFLHWISHHNQWHLNCRLATNFHYKLSSTPKPHLAHQVGFVLPTVLKDIPFSP